MSDSLNGQSRENVVGSIKKTSKEHRTAEIIYPSAMMSDTGAHPNDKRGEIRHLRST